MTERRDSLCPFRTEQILPLKWVSIVRTARVGRVVAIISRTKDRRHRRHLPRRPPSRLPVQCRPWPDRHTRQVPTINRRNTQRMRLRRCRLPLLRKQRSVRHRRSTVIDERTRPKARPNCHPRHWGLKRMEPTHQTLLTLRRPPRPPRPPPRPLPRGQEVTQKRPTSCPQATNERRAIATNRH